MTNPYNYTSPIIDSSNYIGRSDVKAEINAVLRSQHGYGISISAQRRMGTTSTLNLALGLARDEGWEVTYIDLRTLQHPINLNVLEEAIIRRGNLSKESVKPTDLDSYFRGNKPILLAIDEFDIVEQTNVHAILGRLSHYLNGQYIYNDISRIIIMIGSQKSLYEMEGDTIHWSPLSNNYSHISLQPLTFSEAKQLVCVPSTDHRRSLELDSTWLIRFAGRWPFFLTIACHHAFALKASKNLKRFRPNERAYLEEQIWERALPHLDALWAGMNARQREIVSNPRKCNYSAGDSRFDRDIRALIKDGLCIVNKASLEYASVLFQQYFSTAQNPPQRKKAPSKSLVSKDKRSKVFISYSHADAEWLERLRIHLKPMEREEIIDIWDDTKIQAGTLWKEQIAKAIGSARVAVLLISANFLASDFIQQNELPPLLKAAKEEGAIIIPIIVSPSRYTQIEGLSKFQSANSPSQPLTSLSFNDQEEILVKITLDIESALSSL